MSVSEVLDGVNMKRFLCNELKSNAKEVKEAVKQFFWSTRKQNQCIAGLLVNWGLTEDC